MAKKKAAKPKKKKTPAKEKKSKHDPTNKDEAGLTPMQEKFVLHYCNDPKHNATKAAKDAGYSEETAGQLGWQLLQIPSINKAITAKLEERYNILDITGFRILREVSKIAFGSLKDVAKWNGKEIELLDSDELDDIGAAMLKSISASESFSESSSDTGSSSSRSKSISFGVFSKEKALELLLKNKGMLQTKLEHSGTVKLEDILAASYDEDDE
jgi:phage terminase small subunit